MKPSDLGSMSPKKQTKQNKEVESFGKVFSEHHVLKISISEEEKFSHCSE